MNKIDENREEWRSHLERINRRIRRKTKEEESNVSKATAFLNKISKIRWIIASKYKAY